MDQLKEYLIPIKEKISCLNNQIAKVNLENKQAENKVIPKLNEIKVFTQEASRVLNNLNFNTKKAIIKCIVDKVVGTRDELQVYGYIPIESNINVFTINRNCWSPKCR